ncbi:Spermidine/putrescine-binding periplasmic protein [Candidatus Profftia lariciata]|uniref:spermidine/putrescine ABC transporter substrate-binding protein PotD n=1 Tax=Candidatus Profftia lariciata TaxID=1987921 RepID=UPI001D01116B|nr:spermidine/putrescine ABC transporter substrate-binding protein PotD [Candidatus Profftia lariciata]UDG81596.1 Spermidine/putrescine-binding periplasmic protein [Candidatus Profftia lariciata]
MKKCLLLVSIVILLSFVINIAIATDQTHKTHENNIIYFYNWTEYVPLKLLEQFTQETGIKVVYSTYESNETMYVKLKTYHNSTYDLIVPSTYFVAKMSKAGMLKKIDKCKLSNLHNLDKNLLYKPFDPKNEYSIPYLWGATVIGINSDYIDPASITSWGDLWKKQYKGSLLLTDDTREVFHMALLKLGYSGNTTNRKQIQDAYEELKKLMPNVLTFNSDNPAHPYIEGEVNLGMIWNGSAFIARESGMPLKVIVPKEGGIFWMDSLSIPVNAKNIDGALKLINYLLRPNVAAQIVKTIGYPTPNLAAQKLLPKYITDNKYLYPDAKTILHGEWQNDVGNNASAIYEHYFQKLKAQHINVK